MHHSVCASFDPLIDGLVEARFTRTAFDHGSVSAPLSLAEGYRAQQAHVDALLNRLGGVLAGYKLGATNPATMKALGFDAPYHGPILSAWLHRSPAVLPRSDFFLCVIEAEVAFRLSRDLTSVNAVEDVVGAIGEVFPALEIADSRLKNWQSPGPAAILADLGNAGALICGAPAAGWREIDFDTLPVAVTVNGETVASGTGAAVMDNPLGRLTDFARQRAMSGQPLKAGDIVSTGSCTPLYPAKAGQRIMGHFGPLGAVELTLL